MRIATSNRFAMKRRKIAAKRNECGRNATHIATQSLRLATSSTVDARRDAG